MSKIFLNNLDSGNDRRKYYERDIKNNTDKLYAQNGFGNYKDTKGDTGSFITNEAALARCKEITGSNQTLLHFEESSSQKLYEANQINSELNTLLIKVNNGTYGADPSFRSKIEGMLDDLTKILNSRHITGEAFFAGVNSNSDAVQDLNTFIKGTTGTATTPDYSYYRGGEGGLSLNIDENSSIKKFSVTAQDPAFEKLIRALGLCLKADPDKLSGNPEIAHALDLTNSAQNNDFLRIGTVAGLSITTLKKSTDSNSLQETNILQQMEEAHFQDFLEIHQNIETNKALLAISRHLTLQKETDLRKYIDSQRL